ncbi:glycoside hydrolase family 13 protein [Exidia glandulosa HHB12029]|uniref:Glycogen debranching enzyme n=1 Tax=Exidia glandulosa HHB12029 TaxID=1314781 RepID=A0A166BCP4_EXIGL|nr:glycoside hydrolase family 13 protein [Exidia glandulosa HHB12029]
MGIKDKAKHMLHADGKPASIKIPDGPPQPPSLKTPKTPADEAIDFFSSAVGDGEHPVQVYELQLDDDGGPNKDRSYIRLPPPYRPYILRVSLRAGTPATRNGVLKTNFPLDGGKFERTKFVERTLPTTFSKPVQIDLPISHAGAFVYWIEYDNGPERVKGREGYFNIDPVLTVKSRAPILSDSHVPLSAAQGGGALQKSTTHVSLDGLAILTVVSKWMGSLAEWKPHLVEAQQRGYNMLHFTPLQQRGESMSPYSIADQMAYDKALFEQTYKGSAADGRERVKEMLRVAREEHGLLSLTDVVLNHTANNSEWLQDHPEAGFSPFNTPHLLPAFELDTCILEFSKNVGARGLPTRVTSQADVDMLMTGLKQDLDALNMWQYYVLDTTKERESVKAVLMSGSEILQWTGPDVQGRTVVQLAETIREQKLLQNADSLGQRFARTVDPTIAASLVKSAFTEITDSDALAAAWIRVVDVINVPLYEEWNEDTRIALQQIKSRVEYTRLADHGPKWGEINAKLPLADHYFTRIPANSRTKKHDPLALAVANNGWIWDANPLVNFALPPSKAYLRREVIAWGDCVKLRYGSGPEDNPWLWKFMTEYVCDLAATFDGFRIDNCHSTPLHVGVTLLDAARVVNPDLYVCAELFTGSEEMDVHFVSRLGINSLIRESYNGHDPKELSRLLYRHGVNKPIGSMDGACLTSPGELPPPPGIQGPTRSCLITPLQGSMPHALLYDLTHDNESPLHKRTAEDALSTGALVAFSYCAIGSVKGFDDLYPKLLDLVGDNRRYELAASEEYRGISKVKRILNHLHSEMVLGGYSEGHVHQENDYIVMHRIQPVTQKGYLVVAHTAFPNTKMSKDRGWIDPIRLARTKAECILAASIEISSYEVPIDSKTIRGLPSSIKDLDRIVPVEGKDGSGPYSEIHIPEYFPPGSVAIFETHMDGLDAALEALCSGGADEALKELDLVDLNVLLYRCDGEERDATSGEFGVYNVPGMPAPVYCGLEGWMHPLRHIMKFNDLGHPLCGHLREGTWALDYVHARLQKQTDVFPHLAPAAAWFKERFDKVKETAPSFLRPKYFALIIFAAYKAARRAAFEQCSDFVITGHDFTQALALTSLQMHGLVKSASLDPAKPTPCLAAGLPHFANSWARTWGRDVFISLRGLFLTTGQFDAAKSHILSFMSVVKHGLIPNLLDSCRTPRYNSRDSPWWMLQNIQDYVHMAPNGVAILAETVKRRFPKDDTWVPWDDERAYSESSSIAEIIQEILQRHADGIVFREYNAGPNLDMQMKDEGFNIDIKVDWSTGIIHGGNAHNCGTWMDKMGESTKAGTKGVPGTPRDGAPVEITGLLKSTLRWLAELSAKNKFPFKGVEAEIDGQRRLVTYDEWGNLLQSSFEKCYYVPLSVYCVTSLRVAPLMTIPAATDDHLYLVNPGLINRRGIYKDVYGSGAGREWSDYQLRCNFPVAMTVAPELFDPVHALGALKIADEVLRGPMGMKTLDPTDMQYRGDYDNSNDSDDASIAKGWNYHNGPEWGWPLGYFLRAYLNFDTQVGKGKEDPTETLHYLHTTLLRPRAHIQNDPWAGIPELTNANGSFCKDSCPTQAWSMSTLLDFLQEVQRFE